MKYFTIPPSDHLKDIVRYFWVLESAEPYVHYSMADVCPELVFHYHGRFDEIAADGSSVPSFTAGVHGQSSRIRRFTINGSFGILGVYLYPHAVSLLFNVPPVVLTNEMTDLNTLLKTAGDNLEEQVALAPGHPQRIQLIEAFITRRLLQQRQQQPPVFHAIQAIIESKGQITVKQLAQDYFLSERQFERQFRQFSGFSPKLFSRISRFQWAIAQYGNNFPSLTQLALESGYYDQSHFIHDFREFSGQHPRHYFSGNTDATRWRD
ncbi:DUF6597 domain-containing transcriptional factor [Chitinophaga solisilvae]|uniref:DUF6597 domain-containing transcriptional factor n=1 Tax=Chitinophaga solisilvae TaxID=1233460 RepID=UPI00136DEB50|nr:DUF6597 domain-containing transcriptional factor [Chitinophaga solisilvae]